MNICDSPFVNPKVLTNFEVRVPGQYSPANVADIFFGEFGLAMRLAARIYAPTLRVSVMRVVRVCPKKQMFRIDTYWIIAMMADT